jgi:uncharacterized circularly permuted ATP-grasp superfamily protein/uncharacterized alpha-E superfamily protein
MPDPFGEYRAASRQTALLDPSGRLMSTAYDELVAPDGRIRPVWRELAAEFSAQGGDALAGLTERVGRLVEDDGITYTEIADEGSVAEQPAPPIPWRLDPVPLMVSAADWADLEAGMVQRSRLLDALLADIYGARRTMTSGLLPPEVIFGHRGYLRAAHGITIPGRHQLFLHGCDVSRWPEGGYRVLADWTQAPSGVGYALAGRRVVASALPEAFEHAAPRALTPFLRAMRLMLQDAMPGASDDEPRVVVLSPGSHSETAFDQAYLASVLGFPLVEAADLVVRDGKLWMRSLGTLEQVHVVLRRVDAEFSDPLDLRPDSQLGVVGLVEVLRRGAVTVVNTLGSGVLENPALLNYLPSLAKALLGEELLLPAVETFWGGDRKQCAHLLANLSRLTIRSAVTGETVDVAAMTGPQRAELARRIGDTGWQWVGQQRPLHGVAPSILGAADDPDGTLRAAPVRMRLFTLARRNSYTLLAGGMGEVLDFGEDGVAGAVAAKDVWVRAADRVAPAETRVTVETAEQLPSFRAPVVDVVSSPRVLGDMFWMGRYGERAETMARVLTATYGVYRDYRYRPTAAEGEALPVLMAALGRLTGTPVGSDAAAELTALTVDRERSGSLAYAVGRYSQAARSVRDQLSPDTWMVLSGIERALTGYGRQQRRSAHPAIRHGAGEAQLKSVHSAALSGMLALSGVAAESMVRDSGWYAMDIGKRIERGVALVALVATTLTVRREVSALDRLLTETVLRAAESLVTYRRRHHDRTRVAAVAQLLLLDPGNPRSLVYQLSALAVDLTALPGASGSSRTQRLVSEAASLLGRADPADLEALDDRDERPELIRLLDRQNTLLREISESFEATKLSLPGAIQPLWGTAKVTEVTR